MGENEITTFRSTTNVETLVCEKDVPICKKKKPKKNKLQQYKLMLTKTLMLAYIYHSFVFPIASKDINVSF